MTPEVEAVVVERETEAGGTSEPQAHLGTCAECDFTIRFRPSPSGASFTLIGSDQALGMGDHGRPLCPNGHGELAIADDEQLSADDEPFDLAAGQESTPAAARLPFPSPPFNYEGALHAIFEKRKDVAVLESRFNDADERRKKAKAALDQGNDELGEMIDDLQEREEERNHEIARRQQRADDGHPEDTNLVRCTWEQAHPGAVCPLCADTKSGSGETARDSVLHVEAADRFIRLRESDELAALVLEAGVRLDVQLIHGFGDDDRAALRTWAEGVIGGADIHPPRPAVLGTAHVAGAPGESAQSCSVCGAVLLAVLGGEDVEPYPTGTLVGVDCAGAEVEGHRYPERKKRRAKSPLVS